MLFAFRLGLLWLFLGQWGVVGAQQVMPNFVRQITPPPGINFHVAGATEDAKGRLWLATNDGIVRYEGQQFRVYHDPVLKQGDDYFHLIPSPDGRIWCKLGRGSSLSYIDTQLDKLVRIPDSSRVVRDYLMPHKSNFLFADAEAMVWIALRKKGLIRFNPRTQAVDEIFDKAGESVRWITQDRAGRIWFTTNQAVYAYDPVSRRLKTYRQGLGPPGQGPTPGSLNGIFAIGIHARPDGKILVGMTNEVDVIDPATDHIERLTLIPSKFHPDQAVYDFNDDEHGNTYFKTFTKPYRYTAKGHLQQLEFSSLTERVAYMYPGRNNRLWVMGKTLLVYDAAKMWSLPPLNLVDVVINRTRLEESTTKQQLVRDSLGHPTLTVQEGDLITLRVSPNVTELSRAFRLQLSGYDPEWYVVEDATNTVSYPLSAGSYTLALNRSAKTQGWEKNVSTMTIIVQPPFWKTTWFIGLVLLSVSSLGYWFITSQNRRRQLRQELTRREFEAATLRKLDGLKSQFFTNITHELRTPLTIILNATEQVNQAPLAEPDRQRLQSVQRNAQQLMRLINETLDMARLDADKLDRREQIGDPLDFVEQVVGQFTDLARQRQISLNWTSNASAAVGGAAMSLYRFDGDKLEKITYNLLANALKFTPAGGQVHVDGQLTSDHRFTLQIADTGIGIPADQLTRIFERFHQVDSSSTRAYAGTGIGLALVKELTDWLGGSVEVASTLGQGSVFTVWLPLTPVLPTDQTALTSASVEVADEPLAPLETSLLPFPKALPDRLQPQGDNRPLVLVVEDNEELRTYISAHLATDYRVGTAQNGREGLEQALAAIPDLIVSDVMMPELDGYDLVDRLKTDERTSHIPIILLTAKASYDSRMKGLGAGADNYMGKPFSLEELSLHIGNSLRTRQNWQQRLTASLMSTTSKSSHTPALDKEERFLNRLRGLVLDHLTDEVVDVDWLIQQSGMSRAQLHRKLKALTDMSATRFIHRVRIGKAVELLQTGELNVGQVAQAVGYSSQSYFTKIFQEQLGFLPTKRK